MASKCASKCPAVCTALYHRHSCLCAATAYHADTPLISDLDRYPAQTKIAPSGLISYNGRHKRVMGTRL